MEFAGEITDPVHKYIRFSQVEREVIDSPAFQRLRRIRQLAGAHLVYPSAQHSRFEHSLGAMHIAGLAGETLLSKRYINQAEMVQDLRLAALLHDIGHGPFSHLFEELLEYHCNTTHEELGKKDHHAKRNSRHSATVRLQCPPDMPAFIWPVKGEFHE